MQIKISITRPTITKEDYRKHAEQWKYMSTPKEKKSIPPPIPKIIHKIGKLLMFIWFVEAVDLIVLIGLGLLKFPVPFWFTDLFMNFMGLSYGVGMIFGLYILFRYRQKQIPINAWKKKNQKRKLKPSP